MPADVHEDDARAQHGWQSAYAEQPSAHAHKLHRTLDKLVNESLQTAQINDYADVEDIYPCSPMQAGILLSQLQNPRRYLFHTVMEVKSAGSVVDPIKLSEACALVVDRHAALRTVFTNSVCRDGTFDQIVLKPCNHRISIIKCREIEVMAKLNARSLAETQNTWSIPPYQITICQTPEGKVIMKLEMNHAVTDGASTSLIIRDISRAYFGNLPRHHHNPIGIISSIFQRDLLTHPSASGPLIWAELVQQNSQL